MTKGCLYCGLRLPNTAEFCPECGRPIERGFAIRPIQESEFDCLREEKREKPTNYRYAVEASCGSVIEGGKSNEEGRTLSFGRFEPDAPSMAFHQFATEIKA